MALFAFFKSCFDTKVIPPDNIESGKFCMIFQNNFQFLFSEYQTVWIQIRPDKKRSGLTFVGPDLDQNCLQEAISRRHW